MTAIERLEVEIKRFLESAEPEVLCISGDWGVGKTYSWDKIFKEANSKGNTKLNRYSYASLFGVQTLDAFRAEISGNIETIVVEKSEKIHQKLVASQEYLSKYKAYNWCAEKLNRNKSAIKKIPQLKGYSEAYELFQFSRVNEQIICIDDLERMNNGLCVQDVFGLISRLREQRSCKIVILLNKDELDKCPERKKKFEEHSEKVIDTFLKFEPTSQEAVKIADPDKNHKDSYISENCLSLNISNIRVIKKIARLANIIRPHLSLYDESIRKQFFLSLTLFAWCKYQPTLAPGLEYITENFEGSFLRIAKKSEGMSDQEKSWESILASYGFSQVDEMDQVVLDFVNNGYLDLENLQSIAKVRQETLKLEATGHSFSRAWDLYHGSFGDNKSEVVDAIYQSFFEGVNTITPMNLNGSVKLFKELGEYKKATDIIEHYVKKRDEKRDFWSLKSMHRFPDDIDDPEVTKAFQDKYDSFTIDFDPIETLLKIGTDSGWNDEDTQQLRKLTAADFYKLFKSVKEGSLSKIVRSALRLTKNDISKTATEALVRIGKESDINARRVRTYGIEI